MESRNPKARTLKSTTTTEKRGLQGDVMTFKEAKKQCRKVGTAPVTERARELLRDDGKALGVVLA